MSPVRETTSFSNRVKSIYLAADTRSPNTILDVFEATEQSSGSNLQQVASGIADLPAVCLASETNNSSAKKPFCFETYIIVCQYHEVLPYFYFLLFTF